MIFYAALAYRSTRFAALTEGGWEEYPPGQTPPITSLDAAQARVLLIKRLTKGVANWVKHTRSDPTKALVSAHLFNPSTYVLRLQRSGDPPLGPNEIAKEFEVRRNFIAFNPGALDALQFACEWFFRFERDRPEPVRQRSEPLTLEGFWGPSGFIALELKEAAFDEG